MSVKKPDPEKVDPVIDIRRAEYTEILIRGAQDIYAAIGTEDTSDSRVGRAPLIVALQDFIEVLRTKLAVERDEHRATLYSRPPTKPPKQPDTVPCLVGMDTLPSRDANDSVAAAIPPPPKLPSDLGFASIIGANKTPAAIPKNRVRSKKTRSGQKSSKIKKAGGIAKRHSSIQ
ncbi:MAG: hypothetical protein ABIB04_01940 [Patescibacteria group bacterium]